MSDMHEVSYVVRVTHEQTGKTIEARSSYLTFDRQWPAASPDMREVVKHTLHRRLDLALWELFETPTVDLPVVEPATKPGRPATGVGDGA